MWLEIKAIMTVMAMVFILIGTMCSSGVTVIVLMLVLMGIGFMLFGDIIIGYQITLNELKPQMDRTPGGMELSCFQEIGGDKLHFINTRKFEMGIRKFRWHGKDAAVINDGKGMFTLPNGNRGYFAHESYDKNISMILCKALEDIGKKTNSKDIKEIYDHAIKDIKEYERGRVHNA